MDSVVKTVKDHPLIAEIDNNYIHTATSENTRLAYQADIDHFLSRTPVMSFSSHFLAG